TIILENPPTPGVQQQGPLVFRGVSSIPGEAGPVLLTIDPNQNLSGAVFEGLDYEAIYILDSPIFGHGDWGRLTSTVNGTWLSRAELQIDPNHKRFGIAGQFVPSSFALTSSLPWHRANFSIFYDGPADTWLGGLDRSEEHTSELQSPDLPSFPTRRSSDLGDWGRLTSTVNGTWLSRAELQIDPNHKRFGIAGQFVPSSFALTSSLPWHRANFSIFYDGPADTWLGGLD